MSLLTSLVSYWRMDEASGDALDAHGSNDLTDNNTVGSAAGIISNGRDFESSSNQYFTHASNASLQTGDIDFTFNVWVNFESTGTNVVIGKWAGAETEHILYWSANAWNFLVQGGSGSATISHTPSVGTWYMITAWHDATNNQVGIAVNAGTPSTSSYSGGITAGGAGLFVGVSGDGGNNWDGLIDEVGFWKRVLTSGERTQLYNSGAGLAYPFSFAPVATVRMVSTAVMTAALW